MKSPTISREIDQSDTLDMTHLKTVAISSLRYITVLVPFGKMGFVSRD